MGGEVGGGRRTRDDRVVGRAGYGSVRYPGPGGAWSWLGAGRGGGGHAGGASAVEEDIEASDQGAAAGTVPDLVEEGDRLDVGGGGEAALAEVVEEGPEVEARGRAEEAMEAIAEALLVGWGRDELVGAVAVVEGLGGGGGAVPIEPDVEGTAGFELEADEEVVVALVVFQAGDGVHFEGEGFDVGEGEGRGG